jgi:twitching motility protein PilT
MALPLPQLLKIMVDEGGTDLHITTNSAPLIRVHGLLKRIEHPALSPSETKQMIYSILNDNQKYKFEENWELDFSFGIKGLARFRANVFMQRGAVAGAFRRIPYEIWSFEKLGLPAIVPTMTNKPRGLILVTGPTGSGKTTTLASMIDKINKENPVHIITIEDPIEYLHSHRKAMVNQRELHADTKSFPLALRSVLREDPDVVLIGEMRDLETIQAAITIAETGHLTFATLHTNSAAQTINRIIDVFPPAVHEPGGHHHPGAAAQGRRPRPLPGGGGADPDARHPPPDPRQQDPPDLLFHADGAGKIRDDHL